MITATTTNEEIWAIVMERFPKLPTERTCITEHRLRNEVRHSYKMRLYDERSAAQRILEKGGTTSGAA
jgi:hypothetical protein